MGDRLKRRINRGTDRLEIMLGCEKARRLIFNDMCPSKRRYGTTRLAKSPQAAPARSIKGDFVCIR